MRGYLISHVIHVVGTRMKELGIDGLSRGDFLEWVMTVKYPLGVLPLDVVALDRYFGCDKWIRYWWGCKSLIKLNHVVWFTQGHSSEGYMWSPPLATMETSMDMIKEASHNRPYVFHVIVFLWFMIHLWS